MEFLPYFDLCSFLHTCRANSSSSNPVEPTINETLYILYQVSSALVYLARHRIVHNEVAARNCLVGADLSIKLCDFGHSVYVPPNQTTVHVQDNESFLTRVSSTS